MVDYLTELFQNVIMTKMEEGLVTWSDMKKVNKMKKTYVRSTGANSNNITESNGQAAKKVVKNTKFTAM